MSAYRRRVLCCVLVVLLLSIVPIAACPPEDESPILLSLTVLDVGQGDAILITTSDDYTMLVDGGPRGASDVILRVLRDNNISMIDVLIVTHPDADHIGGLPEVLQEIPVLRIVDTGLSAESQIYDRYFSMISTFSIPVSHDRTGSSFALGPATVRVLWPGGDLPKRRNESSIVVELVYGEFSALLTGDVEAESEGTMVQLGLLSQVDALKVAHHGSSTATTAAFLDVVRPAIAIISVGEGNRYGHPSDEVLSRLSSFGAETYRTDFDGSVTLGTDGRTWRVDTEHPRVLPEPEHSSDPDTRPEMEGVYCGSKNSDVFHYTWCKHVESIKPANRRAFSTREDAIAAGYRPCTTCEP